MPAPKGVSRVIPNRSIGRPKGSVNKISQDVRSMILNVVDKVGGAERMQKWVESSPVAEQAFWTQVVPKVLPKDINVGGQADNPLNIGIKVVFVDPEAPAE